MLRRCQEPGSTIGVRLFVPHRPLATQDRPAERRRSGSCAGKTACTISRCRLVDAAQHQQRELPGGARHRLRVAADAEIEQQALLDHDETRAAARPTWGPAECGIAYATHIAHRSEGLLDSVEDTGGG